jgi:hypothetical protein
VSSADRFERMICWYPTDWRTRYGAELAALLEDTYGTGPVPLRARLSLARAGAAERARAAGALGDSTATDRRMKAGSLLVLCAWAFFVVGGAIFAKFTEHWDNVTPRADRAVPAGSFTAVQVAAAIGLALVVAASLLVLPALVRLVREQGWSTIGPPVLRALRLTAPAIVVMLGTVVWAQSLNAHDRNGGLAVYGVAFVVSGLLAVVALGASLTAAVRLTLRLSLSRSVLRLLGAMALVLTLLMVVIIVGTVAWWAEEARYAPWVLRNGIGGGIPFSSDVVPPALLASGFLMLLGLAVAAVGARRLVGSFRTPPGLSES